MERFDNREKVLERLRTMKPADIKALFSTFLDAAVDDATKTRIRSVIELPDDEFMKALESKLTDADIVALKVELLKNDQKTRPRSNSSPFGGRKSVRRHRRRGKKTVKRTRRR